jgi:hypothetical protein
LQDSFNPGDAWQKPLPGAKPWSSSARQLRPPLFALRLSKEMEEMDGIALAREIKKARLAHCSGLADLPGNRETAG